jgi:hypothetical protein
MVSPETIVRTALQWKGVFHETAELALEKANAVVITRAWTFRF